MWGLADERPGTESDAIERELQTCFCCNNERDAVWLALRSRLREQKSIDSLRGLVANLDGLRESRKAVIAVTMGWRLVPGERPADDRPGHAGPDRRRAAGRRRSGRGSGDTRARSVLVGRASRRATTPWLVAAYADTQQLFQDLIGEANRSSTSFYTLDAAACGPRGVRSRHRQRVRLAARQPPAPP